MTLFEAISQINNLKPNTYSQTDKVKWLSTLDGIIKTEIIDTHEGAGQVEFNGYDDDTDLSTELIAPAPYDSVYIRWLEAQIDYANNEYDKYNNSIALYNTEYSSFARFYNRTHMPLGKKMRYFGDQGAKATQAAHSITKITIEEN